ncbi:MAG: C1 family peptidase [Bacteroidales bacterium]|nr:C1 family peptidase [Bacteroidales bacterium]
MKKELLYALAMFCALPSMAQEGKKGFEFTPVKELKITPIKNQNRSGTCWSFSGLGFLESELLRQGKPEVDLSEMFVVYHCYSDRADKFVRLHGDLNFGPGGSFYDVLYVMANYGLVPDSIYTGLQYGEKMHVHNEIDMLTKAYVEPISQSKGKLSPVWKKGFDGILDAYLGELPKTFVVDGKEYTPMSYAQSLGLNADDYVSITSYTHHPFYTSFPLEIQDNWRWANSYNVTLDEMLEIAVNAVNKGYPIAWGADVSEKGFTRNGVGIMPDVERTDLTGSDAAHWLGLSSAEKDAEIRKMMEGPCPEINVTQESRQEGFDNYETTDDHGMVIYGLAKDQTGKNYFMIKNSWGETGAYKGIWYISEPFFKAKTMNYIVHKDALPKNIAKKLGIK